MTKRKKPVDPRTDPSFPGPEPQIDESGIIETIVSDIVVIGGGSGGTQAALAAAEGGASVSVVELQKEENKTWFGEQVGHFNSKFLIDRGCGPYDGTEIVREFVRQGNYRVNPNLIAKYVFNSGEMFDHMISLVPGDSTLLDEDQYNIHKPWGNPEYPIVVGGVKSWAGTVQFRGDILMERPPEDRRIPSNTRLGELERFVMERSRELGAKWYFQHRAVVLVKEDGAVRGVIAKNADGKYVRFLGTKGTVIATGGVMGDTGARMGLWAGGHFEYTPREYPQPWEAARCFGMTSFLTLNRKGRRFFDESVSYAFSPAIYRQPKGMICAVTDRKWSEHIKVNGLQHGNPDFGQPLYIEQVTEDMNEVLSHGAEGYLVRSSSLSEREYERVWAANTLEELADYLGYEGGAKETFLAEIARYNEMCCAGRDTDFCKDPQTLFPVNEAPFYGFRTTNERGSTYTLGVGLVTDNDFRVLDDDDEPIEGLYVIGDNLGGFFGLFYATPCGGVHIGSAMTHGRVLGKALAEQ